MLTQPSGSRGDQQLRRARRVVLVLAWLLATGVGLYVASTTKIGPVVLSLSRNHGVHLGDLLAFLVSYGAALLLTVCWPPPRR